MIRFLPILFLVALLGGQLGAQTPRLEGKASFYGPKFDGKLTSTGEVFRQNAFSAASLDMPWGTILEVTNLANGKKTQVRVNDCGPHARGRIIDLSRAAARALDAEKAGEINVRLRVIRASNAGPTCSRGAWAKRLKAAGKPIPPKPGTWKPQDTAGALPPAAVQAPPPGIPTTAVSTVRPTTVRQAMADPGGPMEGMAGYYPDRLQGRPTSTGEIYDVNALTAASKEYPYNTILEVTNVVSGQSVRVRVNDCGPFRVDQILELSHAAAARIGLLRAGTARVRARVVTLGQDGPTCNRSTYAQASSPAAQPTAAATTPTTAPAGSPNVSQPNAPQTYERSVSTPQPAPKRAKPQPREFEPDEMLFGVQIAAFKSKANADKMMADLRKRDVSPVYSATVNGVTRVFAGKFYFPSQAKEEMAKLRVMGYEGATVRRIQ